MTIRIEPYKRWSGGARALGEHCGILRATQKQVDKHGDFTHIINWGSSQRRFEGVYINTPEAVALASNKLETAKVLGAAYVPQPAFTTSKEVAEGWIEKGYTVVERHLTRASAGRGIRLAFPASSTAEGVRGLRADGIQDNGSDAELTAGGHDSSTITAAPLYTRYMKKADEFRVHVFSDKVIDVQQKRKRQEVPNDEVDYQIRNASNGWVFCRAEVDVPEAVLAASRRAVKVLGLDFGAVDIGYNRHNEECFVFEVNTAPGLEGTTLVKYFEALSEAFPQLDRGAYARRRAA